MKISVVIPYFEARDTLWVAVKSALDAYEVLIVDDGSLAPCESEVRNWNWPNVQVIRHHENQGLGAARNTGIMHSTGDWIAFLDADDAYETGWHRALSTYLAHAPTAQWVYHPIREWTGHQLKAVRRSDPPTHANDWILRRPAVAPSACALRSEIAKSNLFDTNRRLQGTEDLELWMRLWQQGIRPLQWTDEAFTLYRIGRGMSAELESHSTKIRLRWTQFVERGWIHPEVLQLAERELQRQKARSYHKAGRYSEARRAYQLAGPSAKNWLMAIAAALHLKV